MQDRAPTRRAVFPSNFQTQYVMLFRAAVGVLPLRGLEGSPMRRFANSGGQAEDKLQLALPPSMILEEKSGINPRRADLGIFDIDRDTAQCEATLLVLGARFFFTMDRFSSLFSFSRPWNRQQSLRRRIG